MHLYVGRQLADYFIDDVIQIRIISDAPTSSTVHGLLDYNF